MSVHIADREDRNEDVHSEQNATGREDSPEMNGRARRAGSSGIPIPNSNLDLNNMSVFQHRLWNSLEDEDDEDDLSSLFSDEYDDELDTPPGIQSVDDLDNEIRAAAADVEETNALIARPRSMAAYEPVREGRLTRRRRMRPWRTVQEMYNVQTRAFKAAMAVEAKQDLAMIQSLTTSLVELTPDDERSSDRQLANRFLDHATTRFRMSDWIEHRHPRTRSHVAANGLDAHFDDDMVRFFWTSATDVRVRSYRSLNDRENEASAEVALQNSVLSLHGTSRTVTWCPCYRLGATSHPGLDDNDDERSQRLREAFCSASLQRKSLQKRLLDEVYLPQSRGVRVRPGLEAYLYAMFRLANCKETDRREMWRQRYTCGAGEQYDNRPDIIHRSEIELHDIFADQPSDAGEGCSLSSQMRHTERAIAKTRFVAKGPLDLWPGFGGCEGL